MLKKVSDQPLVEDPDAPQSGGDVAVLHPVDGGASEPRERQPGRFLRFIGRFSFAILQAVLMIAILFGSYMIAKRMIAAKPEAKKRPPFSTVYTVETVTPVRADNQPTFVAYGQTQAARSVELRALVSGEVVSINDALKAGAAIAKGEPLVSIDPFEYRGALLEAEAAVREAQARISENEATIALERTKIASAQEQLDFAQADFERAERLRQNGTVTQQQLEARKLVVSQRAQALDVSKDTIKVQEARLEQLKANLSRLNWKVDQAQRAVDSTTLVAPFDAIVRSSTAETGRVVTANDVVVSLYEAGSLEVKFTLTDAQYGRLQTSEQGLLGRNVDIRWAVGGKEYDFEATIERVGAEITSDRGGVEVIGRLTDITRGVTLRPGAFVEVTVPDVVFAGTFSVPDTALYGKDTVYTVVDGKLAEKKVSVATYAGENVLISDGLEPGDVVLTTRITEVSTGLDVRREGDPVERRNAGAEQDQEARARPSPDELARIRAANNLSEADFAALSLSERRKLIRAYRKDNAPTEAESGTEVSKDSEAGD